MYYIMVPSCETTPHYSAGGLIMQDVLYYSTILWNHTRLEVGDWLTLFLDISSMAKRSNCSNLVLIKFPGCTSFKGSNCSNINSSFYIRLPISFLYYTYMCFYNTQCTFKKSFLFPFLYKYTQCTCNANFRLLLNSHFPFYAWIECRSSFKFEEHTIGWRSVPCTPRLSVLHGTVDAHQFSRACWRSPECSEVQLFYWIPAWC